MFSYSKLTNNIRVTMTPVYDSVSSNPGTNYFNWKCELLVENLSLHKVKLVSLRLTMVEISGLVRRDEPLFLAEDPMADLDVGHTYRHVCVLETKSPGAMITNGEYLIIDDGAVFYAEVPTTALDSPISKNCYN